MLTGMAIILDKRRECGGVDVVHVGQIEGKRLAPCLDFAPEHRAKCRCVMNVDFAGETQNLDTASRSVFEAHIASDGSLIFGGKTKT